MKRSWGDGTTYWEDSQVRFPATDIEFAMQHEINQLKAEVERLTEERQANFILANELSAELEAAKMENLRLAVEFAKMEKNWAAFGEGKTK